MDEDAQLALVVGEGDGNRIVFALESASEAFLMGPISVRQGGEWIRLAHRNGIETLALAYFRDDLRSLLVQGGILYFGDHEYEQMMTIEAQAGCFVVSVDLPSEDLWEIPIQHVTGDGLQKVVEVIDEAEARFGPLTEHCECGLPERHWRQRSSD